MSKYDLTALRKEMARKNILFHFVRNSPRSTNRFYHRFISIIGYDVWNYYEPYIVNSWKSAEYSFDKMYGLIKAWSKAELPEVDEKRKDLYIRKAEKAYNDEIKKLIENDEESGEKSGEDNKSVIDKVKKFCNK